MADRLNAGGLDAFAGSMAQAMEDALNELLKAEGRPQVPTDNSAQTRDRRIMFVAIARGVVDHLVANQAAFTIHTHPTNDTEISNHHVHIEKQV